MTEPTAEQVSAERERAHEIVGEIPCIYAFPDKHNFTCTAIATALARVRIEAHAAGRDEGVREAEELVTERLEHWRQNCQDNIDAGCVPPQYNMGARSEASIAADAIRALRGRT